MQQFGSWGSRIVRKTPSNRRARYGSYVSPQPRSRASCEVDPHRLTAIPHQEMCVALMPTSQTRYRLPVSSPKSCVQICFLCFLQHLVWYFCILSAAGAPAGKNLEKCSETSRKRWDLIQTSPARSGTERTGIWIFVSP